MLVSSAPLWTCKPPGPRELSWCQWSASQGFTPTMLEPQENSSLGPRFLC